uniref:KlcB n=1 Tax=Salmonella dublin TaxID=98360 RepID=A7KZX7_SALDU|nr:hypothetical protein [Salmonella enterica]ABS71067.1 KlcB [Salmonella enterica subsp. enterica serovar Dublin]
MSRKHQPKTERQEKAAVIAASLPEDRGELMDAAAEAIRQYDAAIVGCDDDAAHSARDRYEAVIWKLNGNSFFGTKADADSPGYQVERHCAATPGTVPLWGQKGEFLMTVEGIRAVVEFGDGYGSMYAHFAFHAVDLDLPFISETGYRSHFTPVMGGMTVDEAAEAIMRAILAEKGRVLIKPDSRQFYEGREARAWLDYTRPAQTIYQEGNGQIAFGF